MPATSFRSRLAKNLAPLKPHFYKGSERIRFACQMLEPSRVELSLSSQFEARSEAIRIPCTISPEWLHILADQAMPAQDGRVHEIELLEGQGLDLSLALLSEVTYEEIDLPSQSTQPSQTLVDLFDGLFEPLGWTDVDGKHYGTRQARTEETPAQARQGDARTRPQLPESDEREDERRIGQERKKPHHKPQPSFWDIILPILQPPLDLGAAKPVFLPHPLYPFQHPGVHFLLEHTSALLGDEMGTGKTVMASVAMRILFRRAQIHRALVVCPVSVLRSWDRHLMEWAPELSVTIAHGPSAKRRIDWVTPAHVYLTTYDTLRSDVQNGHMPKRMRRRFDMVVADEIQYVKNASSKRAQALRRLAPQWRWGLSGTPMENKPEDIVSIFRFLKPGLMDDDDSPGDIQEKMSPHFLRRRKKDVLPDLPDKDRQEMWLDLAPAQRRAYRKLEAQIKGDFVNRHRRGEGISRIHIFAAIQKLKQICNFAPGKTSSPKTDALKDIVEEIAANDSKIIIFSQYVEEGIAKLAPLLEPFGVTQVVGGQSRATRDAEIEQFRHNPDIHVLLATIKSGGVGLTLTEASYVVHFDHWWNPALKWQAEDRVHRPGQKASCVNIYEFWMSDTIDERIFKLLEGKKRLFEEIVDSLSADELEKTITDEEWFGILDIDAGAQGEQAETRSEATGTPLSLEETLEKLQAVDPFEFEQLVGELFKYLGYPHTQVTSKSSDGGIDVLAWKNTQGGPERVAIQCKRYKSNVGVKVARELAGVISSDPTIAKGILVTTGGLSTACRRFCGRTPEVEIVEGLQLARYVRNFGIPVP